MTLMKGHEIEFGQSALAIEYGRPPFALEKVIEKKN